MDEEMETDLQMRAGAMHELFMSYVNVGFTREEALQILLLMLRKFFDL